MAQLLVLRLQGVDLLLDYSALRPAWPRAADWAPMLAVLNTVAQSEPAEVRLLPQVRAERDGVEVVLEQCGQTNGG